MKDLVIIGASGHGKVVADIAKRMNNWKEIFFLDDAEALDYSLEIRRVGKINDAHIYKKSADFVVAIGDNSTRKKIQLYLEKNEFCIGTLIDPNSIIASNVLIGIGSVIMPGVIINSSVSIGKGCVINTSSSVDHDSKIGSFVHISPGVHLAGSVRVGDECWLGIGSIVINNKFISSKTIIGAGALILDDIVTSGTYIGVPGKRLER